MRQPIQSILQPRVQVEYKTTATGQNYNTNLPITFTTKVIDNYSASNGSSFWAPFTDTYLVSASIFGTNVSWASGAGMNLALYKGGLYKILASWRSGSAGTFAPYCCGSIPVFLQKNESITFYMYSISQVYSLNGDDTQNWMRIVSSKEQ